MKKILLPIGAAILLVCNVSCETTNARVGIPIPFTNPTVVIGLDAQAQAFPPQFCLGLTIDED